jgi:putative DNA methylase
VIDPTAPHGWRFEVHTGELAKDDEERLKNGTKFAKGQAFVCVLTGSAIDRAYVQAEGKADRLSTRLMAIVAEGKRNRLYLGPDAQHETIAQSVIDDAAVLEARKGFLSPPTPTRAMITGGVCSAYGLRTWGHLFTPRQLVALTTFSDLVGDAREKALADARAAGLADDPTRLHIGGVGAAAYADAVATYLGLGISRLCDAQNALCQWGPGADQTQHLFRRQAIPMVWDYAESSVFSNAAGDLLTSLHSLCKALEVVPANGSNGINPIDAARNSFSTEPITVCTDPPYYDNIGYGDLSDFFYVWLKRSLSGIWPDLFRRLTTPKTEELVATPYRFLSDKPPDWIGADRELAARWPRMNPKERAEAFFMNGMSEALTAMREAATECEPLAIYYAFKQSELAEEGIVSPGWASFLQGVFASGLSLDGTWPVRTERASRSNSIGSNALASSIVLVCRKQPENAPRATRADFLHALRREMPEAVEKIRRASVSPVDMPQSVIGPGMGVFTRYVRVLEDDDSPMTVKTALALINRVWGEIEDDLDANFDAETQVALAWFSTYGFDPHASGDLISMANAKNIPIESLFRSGVFQNLHGKAGLTPRENLPEDWSPAADKNPTVWACVQHTARVLRAEDGGAEAAARLVAAMGARAEDARALAYRLYEIASQKGWASEALVYNELAQDWTQLEGIAADIDAATALPAQGALAL